MTPTLKAFLEGARRNAYISYPGFASLYVRHTQRFGYETLDVAAGAAFAGHLPVRHQRTDLPEKQ